MIDKLSDRDLRALQQALTPRMTKFIPITPTAKQTAALLMNSERELLYGGAAGGGKDMALHTKILTANRGWQTMGSLEVGDYVFSLTGKPTKVVWKSEVMHNPCYKLTFDKGREEFVVGEGHEWIVWRRRQDRKERVLEKQTTKQVYKRFSNNAPRNRGSLYAITIAPPLDFGSEINKNTIDPYVFGAWLGDGNRQSGNMSAVDQGIMDEFMNRGYDVYFTQSSIQHDRPDLYPEGRLHHWCSKRLRDELRELGFLYNSHDEPVIKRIPEAFMKAPYEFRLELLQGMMDTDGCAVDRPTGDVELSLADKVLALQFEELIRGLGIQVVAKEHPDIRNDSRYPKGEYVRYRLNWTTDVPMFRLARKKALQAKETPQTAQWHYLSNITPVESVPTQCIQVECPMHIFLVGKTLIPTHNSVFLLMAALQYVDIPNYAAIIFRKTFSDLMLPGALIPMSHEWLYPWREQGLVKWQDKEKRWTFAESGATLSFGYLDNKGDHYRYQGSEYQFIGFDEVTHIDPESYRYLFSRLRRKANVTAPLRIRATANPGGEFGEYFYERFFVDNIDENTGVPKRLFLQAGLHDNPHLDAEAYRESLAELDPITRAQLEEGNWEIRPKGDLFDKSWVLSIDYQGIPPHARWVRFWDLASIDPKYKRKTADKRAPDWTVGFKLGYADGCYYVADIIKVQKGPGEIEEIIKATAQSDGYSCAIRMEEEGGASGIANTQRYSRIVLQGYDFLGVKPVISKIERARPVAAACQVGNVFISNRCRNLLEFYAQLDAFPNGANDDIVDAFSGAFAHFKPDMVVVKPPPEILTRRKRVVKRKQGQAVPLGHTGSYWLGTMRHK